MKTQFGLLITILLLGLLLGCINPPEQRDDPRLQVIATTNIVADVVGAVGGEEIQLTSLLPRNVESHTFEARPQDVVAVSNAEVVFLNGLGLEVFLDDILRNIETDVRLIPLSDGVDLLTFGEENEAGNYDPHVWFNPLNVYAWVDQIKAVLSDLDPDNAAIYELNSTHYQSELIELDEWISEMINEIPEDARNLVTDHDAFGYLAARYGLEMRGTLIAGYSTLSEPSAQEIAALNESIIDFGVNAIFVGDTVNANLAYLVAQDTGVELVFVYTGSLTSADGPAASYIEMMRFNINAIVEALK